MDFADIRTLNGDQGHGKSVTAVALPVDDYYANLNQVVSPEGELFRARALNEDEQYLFEERGLYYDPLRHVRIFAGEAKDDRSKIITLPLNWTVLSPVKIFANFHFYGIKFVLIDAYSLIEYMNEDNFFRDAWVILDESVQVDKQDTMTREGKLTQKFGAQVAKRDLHFVICVQYQHMLQSRMALFATTKVLCSYDSDTGIVSLDVNDNSPMMVSTDYYSIPYRRFYKRGEVIKVSQKKIDQILSTAGG